MSLALPAPAPPVERTAFYLESEGRSLFAWLHCSADNRASHGILICPPIGHEQVHSHRALRHLADALAGQGFAVLRLDYHGTGDSDGTDQDSHRCTTWLANVRDAVEWLRATAGCQKVSLIGLRMGATLAALYAANHPVENLVLWAPIVRGQRYVRELTALKLAASKMAAEDSSSIEAAGFVFTHETLQELTKISLLTQTPRCEHALIVHNDLVPSESPLFNHLTTMGVAIEQVAFPGYEDMMAEPHETAVPDTAIAGITNWFVAKETHQATKESLNAPVSYTFTRSMLTCGPASVRESIHRLSTSPDLFGIMTESSGHSSQLPCIVMLNAGAVHHIGPGRLHVRLARHFASFGYPCLRIDISGLGESVAGQTQKENDAYAVTAFRDVAIICDYLQQQQPGRPIVLMGLCSGAYAAFQSAAQLPHPALIESILINPLTFFWKEGMTIRDSPSERFSAWHYYKSIIFDLSSWRKLLTGKTRKGLIGTVRRFFSRVMPRPFWSGSSAERKSETRPSGGYGHPAKENPSADLNRVAEASRNMAMFTSESDPGHFLLMCHARRKARQLIRQGRLRCFFINDADHTFSTEKSRAALSQSLTDYLHSRFASLFGR